MNSPNSDSTTRSYHSPRQRPWIIGISGASGICYARRVIELALSSTPDLELDIVASESAMRVMREEEGMNASVGRLRLEDLISPKLVEELGIDRLSSQVTIHSNRNIGSRIASGGYITSGMVIVPCSMKTIAAVAHGYGENLLQRAADVVLKEGRKLIVVPRETPLSVVHLENLLTLAKQQVRVLPAMPGFYHQPKTIEDLVDSVVTRILDHMGIELASTKRWGVSDDLDSSKELSKSGGILG